MHALDQEILSPYYRIYEDLTPEKEWKTFVAFTENTDSFEPVILKEMDYKRASIYRTLMNMWNPHIANVYAVHELPNTKIGEDSQNAFLAVTENAGDQTLTDYVKENGTFTIKTALFICCQICDGLSDFHKQGFVHRDIKPDNIMIIPKDSTFPQIKIIDFGGAKEYVPQKSADTTIVGTQGYQAPESISGNTRKQSDIFSIGCVLNFMLTGQEPGIQRYQDNYIIENIIEKATNDDPSSRYLSVDEMKKVMIHEMRIHAFDKIPVIRSIPGFRTHTPWKMIVASLTYITWIYIICIQYIQKLYYETLEMSFFYVIVPLIMFFNLGNLLRFIPESIRSNNRQFMIFRILFVTIAFSIPLIRVSIIS